MNNNLSCCWYSCHCVWVCSAAFLKVNNQTKTMETIKERLAELGKINKEVDHIDAILTAIASNDYTEYRWQVSNGCLFGSPTNNSLNIEMSKSLFDRLRDLTDATLREFRTRYADAAGELEFVPWYERADFYNKTVALFAQQMGVLRAIIAVIIVLSISNLLVMNVLERTGEIGTLLAIGFRRRRVMQQFAIEGLVLGLVGGGLGVAVGFGLGELISAIGIPMPPPPGMEEGYTGEIRVTAGVVGQAFAIAFVTTALAGLYPAWKASRLQVVDALRHNI